MNKFSIGIAVLFLATGAAHADLEGYARCAPGIVGTGRDENGTELWGLVRWKKIRASSSLSTTARLTRLQ
jgi:hypothetical protein